MSLHVPVPVSVSNNHLGWQLSLRAVLEAMYTYFAYVVIRVRQIKKPTYRN